MRRNAVLAIASLFKLPKGELMLPDAPELVERFLQGEQDGSAKRNAFAMLTAHATDRAVAFLFSHLEQVAMWPDLLQMSVLDLIRKVCRAAPEQKGRYIKIILALLQSPSTAVVYECAGALVQQHKPPLRLAVLLDHGA